MGGGCDQNFQAIKEGLGPHHIHFTGLLILFLLIQRKMISSGYLKLALKKLKDDGCFPGGKRVWRKLFFQCRASWPDFDRLRMFLFFLTCTLCEEKKMSFEYWRFQLWPFLLISYHAYSVQNWNVQNHNRLREPTIHIFFLQKHTFMSIFRKQS